MLEVPEMNGPDVVFGNIKHMPKYETLPEEFRDWHNEAHCRDIGQWFFKGAKPIDGGIQLGDSVYRAKDGVDPSKALAAIKAVLSSWAPKHEHKIAACGYMLSQWFYKSAERSAA